MNPEPRLCDTCEETYPSTELHYCACGALLCSNCYVEDGHLAHDTYPRSEAERDIEADEEED